MRPPLTGARLSARVLADGIEAELQRECSQPDDPEGTATLTLSATLLREIILYLRQVA